MPRISRRDALGAVGFTALAGVAAAAVAKPDAQVAEVLPTTHTDDAELIAIGREAANLIEQRKPLEARWWALPQDSGSRRKETPEHVELHAVGDAMEPIDARLNELADRAMELRATTPKAWIAKARLVRREMEAEFVTNGAIDVDEMQPAGRLTWSLLDDLLGEVA